MEIENKKLQQADIGLILEGTYPYVRGGVSSWIHQIISGLPEFTFAIIFIGDQSSSYEKIQYELPNNVIQMECIYLVSETETPYPKVRKGNPEAFANIKKMHKDFNILDVNRWEKHGLAAVLQHIHVLKDLNFSDFLYSQEAWQFIVDRYAISASEDSFLDFFWTIRAIHGPIFSLMESLDKAVDAKVYHTVSTGYAGFFGVMLHYLHDKQLILTEHGIYTKERKIDLAQVEWIQDAEDIFGGSDGNDFSYLRRLWIRFFEGLGRCTYEIADPIISISEGNKARQVRDGAEAGLVQVISNAVNLKRFQDMRLKRPDNPPLIVGFIGRVVPIKDVKTFLRCMSSVCHKMPEVQAWIIGGEDEDPAYAQECRDIVAGLNLTESVIYKGFCNVAEILPQLGCVVLSSISEGVPLTIMEAFACGIPVIATDVGACKELIEGGSEADKLIGKAGASVPIADGERLADEIVKLLSSTPYWLECCAVAEKRADTYFDEKNLFDSYRKIYQTALDK